MDLPRIIEAAIDTTSGLVGDKSVAVVAEYPAHLPAVEGDSANLADVLTCFIGLAVESMSHGEVKIRAELLPADEAPMTSGELVGNPADLEHGGPWAAVRIAFHPGWAVAETLAPLLTIDAAEMQDTTQARFEACAGVIGEFRGELWLETLEEDRSQLSIALPLIGAAGDQDPDISTLRRMVETRLPEQGEAAKTVLLMVEEAELRTLLSKDLVAAGHRVVVTDRGEGVLPLARTEAPDIVLLDLLAREPTAFEVAVLLKQDRRTRSTPVLFLTSVDDAKGRVSMGAVNFVVRPSDTGALVAAVNSLLQSGLSPSARVLVVEPDEIQRETTVMMIQAHGYRVTEARGAEEALALAERFEPGLVLINAQVAQERDYWLLRGLRQISEKMDVHVVADVISEEEARAAMKRGASGFSETGKLPDLLRRVKGQSGMEK